MSWSKRRVRLTCSARLPKRCVRQKNVRLHAREDRTSSPSRQALNSDRNPSEPAQDSPPFPKPDDTENTCVGLRQIFNGIPARNPSTPKDIRREFLMNEMGPNLEETCQALREERWHNNECICRKPGCEEKRKRYPKCQKNPDSCTRDQQWFEEDFLVW
ncbi:uncharacterized protein MCYG_00771 [Microsporum canis CBS 113480]|uniref:Uncharacterized protein n=1 Tax=Arthroderma otae (strain ATCC MYA-4605 / CBS 113480) TaxID=554155 RepID=C5FDA9_ARTOC|nr:uncharacterized protein MCYG_00771 [Microsporum canis CBS 113480]EEQ27883.1 predicted protein [Microsporum canis CBS 113480]